MAKSPLDSLRTIVTKHQKEIDGGWIILDVLFLAAIYGLYDYSIFYLEKKTKFQPNDADLHYHLARLYLEQKNDYEKGLPLLERAVQLDSTHARAHYHLAAALAHLGRDEAALDFLEKALELGFDDREGIEKDARWWRLRESERFRMLMKKHLPGN